MKIQATKVFDFSYKSTKRFLIHQGSSRSSKTWSILQYLIITALQSKGKIFTICRKTLPALRATAMRDFFELLNSLDLYDESNHNKSDLTYELNGNTFEFISIDQPAKIRGRKRHWLFINESNELSVEDYRQLEIRTTEKIILDFNPSDSIGWWYDLIEQKPDEVDFLISTYKDNPFLEESIIRSIESYKETDDLFWKVFGLGQRGVAKSNIYTNYKTYSDFSNDNYAYGLDFGYNHPSALVRCFFSDGEIHVEELLYESHLTNQELIDKMMRLIPDKNQIIYADAANPEGIENIRRAGFNIKSADKSVKPGIDSVKSNRLFVKSTSLNALKELQLYRWKEVNGNIIDEPVKANDDFCDAMRYAVFNHLKNTRGSGKFDYDFMIV